MHTRVYGFTLLKMVHINILLSFENYFGTLQLGFENFFQDGSFLITKYHHNVFLFTGPLDLAKAQSL